MGTAFGQVPPELLVRSGGVGKYGNGRGRSWGGFLGLQLFPEWVPGTGDGGAVGRCQRTRLEQADGGVRCQSYVPAPPVGYDPPDPGLGAEACDVQDKVAEEGMGFQVR